MEIIEDCGVIVGSEPKWLDKKSARNFPTARDIVAELKENELKAVDEQLIKFL